MPSLAGPCAHAHPARPAPPCPCSSLQCPGCAVKAQGQLPEEVAALPTLAALNLQQNELNGTLPEEYGAVGALPRLVNLVLVNNQLTGAA